MVIGLSDQRDPARHLILNASMSFMFYIKIGGFKLALLCIYKYYTNIPSCRRGRRRQEESKTAPIRGNICIFTSFCTIKYLYHDQKQSIFNLFIRYSSQL